MKKKDKGNSVFSGLFWTFGERVAAQAVSLIVTIILARLLSPENYGIISIVTVFITLCNVFVTSGFGSAVVQKKDAEEIDFNTAFVISLTISIILYIFIFVVAPYIAAFYKMQELTLVTRVMGIRLIIASLNTIQHAHIQRHMKFKKFFISTLYGTIISAVVGIILAYFGFGVWALVSQYLTNTIIDTIVLYFVDDWKPKFQFQIKRAKELFGFGWKVLISELIFVLEADIRSLIVGKVFGSADLAYYDQGRKYPSLLITNINSSINKVMLPAYSKKQDNLENLKLMLRKAIRVGTYVLTPMLIGFAAISSDFITILITEKWIECVPFIQVFCIMYITRPFESSCHQALLAIGKSGLVMWLMFGISAIGIATVLIAVFVFKSVFLIAIGSLISTAFSIILFSITSKKHFKYNIKEQLSDIKFPILTSTIMFIIISFIKTIQLNLYLRLIIQITIGMLIYVTLSIIFKNTSYIYIKDKIKSIIKK